MSRLKSGTSRRGFIVSLASVASSSQFPAVVGVLPGSLRASLCGEPASDLSKRPAVEKYDWKGPYSEMRSLRGAIHSTDACISIAPSWMSSGRIIARAPEDFVSREYVIHCDHADPTHENWSSLGAVSKHILPYVPSSCVYAKGEDGGLVANATIPARARFSFQWTPVIGGLRIVISLENLGPTTLHDVAARLCIIAYDAAEIADASLTRTLIHTDNGFRTLSQLDPQIDKNIYAIQGGPEIRPPQFGNHRSVSRSIATCGLIMVQSLDRRHVIGVGFRSVQMIYTNTTNRCFHADPYIGDVAAGERKVVDGQLYLMSASPADCLEQFKKEFAARRPVKSADQKRVSSREEVLSQMWRSMVCGPRAASLPVEGTCTRE